MRFAMKRKPPITKKLTSPIVFRIDDAGGWHIRSGPSKILIAEGSGYSRPIGMQLFRELDRQHRHARGFLINSILSIPRVYRVAAQAHWAATRR